MFRVVASALVSNVITNAILVPVWDARGAAVAASLAGIVAAIVAFRAFTAESGARWGELMPGRADLMDYVGLATSLLRRG
jgi:peptidoglycan biosynthesis protein MviN/MurJ (putative lipid II flippase)